MSRIVPSTEVGFVGAEQAETEDDMPVDVRSKLTKLGPEAVDRLEQLLWSQKSPQVALGAAREILDRVIPKETKHTENRQIRVILEKSEEAAARLAMEEAEIIDVEAEIV